MKWDYNRYLMGKTVSFFTNGELRKSLEGESDYSLDSEIGLRYKVTEWAPPAGCSVRNARHTGWNPAQPGQCP